MTSIPPNVVGSIAQTGMAAVSQSEKVDQEENDETMRAQAQRRAALQRQGTVDDTDSADGHARVNSDDRKFERQGRRGAAEQEAEPQTNEEEQTRDCPDGSSKDDRPRLDITA